MLHLSYSHRTGMQYLWLSRFLGLLCISSSAKVTAWGPLRRSDTLIQTIEYVLLPAFATGLDHAERLEFSVSKCAQRYEVDSAGFLTPSLCVMWFHSEG